VRLIRPAVHEPSRIEHGLLTATDRGDCESVLGEFAQAAIDVVRGVVERDDGKRS